MSRVAVLSALAVAALVVAVAVPARAFASARLLVVKRTPLTLRGERFRAHEHVRITTHGKTWATRASARGSFTVSFDFSLGRCGGAFVRAVGSNGSVAILKIQLPACSPG